MPEMLKLAGPGTSLINGSDLFGIKDPQYGICTTLFACVLPVFLQLLITPHN